VASREKSRVSADKLAFTNSWLRYVAWEMGDVALVDWDRMLHTGWPRESVLADDMHPLFFFNHAMANIYLNAVSKL
jgi:hypothetical protein